MNVTTEAMPVSDNTTLGGDEIIIEESSDILDVYSTVVNVYIDGLLCLLGFFGNLMTIVVLQRQGVRTSNAVLLQALAVFDSCLLTYVILYVVLRTAGVFTEINAYIVAFVLPFGWTSQTATIWTAMAVVIDRFMMVSRPLKASQWCTAKRARIAVGCIAIGAVLFNAARWPRYYFVAFGNREQNNETFISHLSANIENWNEEIYLKVYHISLTFVFVFLIPLSIIVTLNIGLIGYLMKAAKLRKQMTGITDKNTQDKTKMGGKNTKGQTDKPMAKTNQEDQRRMKSNHRVNVMVAVMITCFVVCELPDFVAAIIGAGQFKKDPRIYKFYAVFKEFLLVLNSTINFYIYMIFYQRFRKEFTSMFGCGRKANYSENSTNSLATSRSTLSISSHVSEESQAAGVKFTLK